MAELLNRREFIFRGAALFGICALELFPACSGQKLPEAQTVTPTPATPYTVNALQRLGKELGTWKLTNGTLMAGRFPEIKKCADLLSGTLDPAQYFPFIKIPIGFSLLPGQETAALAMQKIPDLNDPRRIVATTKDGRVSYAPILAKNTPVDVAMSQDVLDSSIRLPVLVKEMSQILDYPDYSRAFVDYLKSTHGINFTFQNPNNIPTSENEVLISIVNNTALENALLGKPVFRPFVDNGSFLRSGIVFANWYEDQLRLSLKPEGKLVATGLRVKNFLKSRGLIKQDGDLFVWSTGEAPKINDPKFLDLVNGLSSES